MVYIIKIIIQLVCKAKMNIPGFDPRCSIGAGCVATAAGSSFPLSSSRFVASSGAASSLLSFVDLCVCAFRQWGAFPSIQMVCRDT